MNNTAKNNEGQERKDRWRQSLWNMEKLSCYLLTTKLCKTNCTAFLPMSHWVKNQLSSKGQSINMNSCINE